MQKILVMTQRTLYMLCKTKTAKNNTQLHMLAAGSLKKMGGEQDGPKMLKYTSFQILKLMQVS